MKYIYNSNRKTIRKMREHSQEIKLTPVEGKIIEVLCNRCNQTCAEINEYVYGEYTTYNRDSLNQIIDGLSKKIDLSITTKAGRGTILDDQIYIE